MGMEPFVQGDAGFFGPLIDSIPNPLREMQKQMAFKVGLDAKRAEVAQSQAQAEEVATKLSRQQQLQQALAGSDGSPSSISQIMMQFPEAADEIKKGWDVKDEATRATDLTHVGQVYAPAAAGSWDIASKAAHERYEAEKAAGQTDEDDDRFIDAIDKAAAGDESARKFVLNHLGMQAAAAAGPTHFATVYGAMKGGYTLGPGDVRMDENGNVVAHSPIIKGDDGSLYDYNSVMGGGRSGVINEGGATTAGIEPAAAEVASTLSNAGLPAPVVAGFMGNFHAEGGYTGAQGDGGSATGIAQWRGERAANFQRVIGKPVTEASHADQARFVAWEMQNPEAAGMTVAQRDAILAAKTPAQAAALIDKHYERSSGRDRNKRMAAANAFAGLQGGAPAASGGPRVLLPGKTPEPKDSYRLLTPEENTQRGLDPNVRYQVNEKSGQVTALGGQDKSQGQLKPIPQAPKTQILTNRSTLREVDRAIALLTKNPDAIGYWKSKTPDAILQRADPGGVGTRAAVGKIGGKIIHDVSGAAVTLSEAPRFQPYVPQAGDSAATALKKLQQLRALAAADTTDLESAWGPDNGYTGLKLPSHGGGAGPVKVRSVQEARKLPSGTLFVTPDGRTLRKK